MLTWRYVVKLAPPTRNRLSVPCWSEYIERL